MKITSKQIGNSPVTSATQKRFVVLFFLSSFLRCRKHNNLPLLITEFVFLALPSDLLPHDLRPSFSLFHRDQQQDWNY